MAGESKKNSIFGEPFNAIETILIDSKPNNRSCIAIIRLGRD